MQHADMSVLLLVDVQKGFDHPKWGERNNPMAEANISRLLEKWRERGWPIVHVQHLSSRLDSPLHPFAPGCDFKDEIRPLENEIVLRKIVNSAFIGTGLSELLVEKEWRRLVIAGLTTPHCISTTARMASNLGYAVSVVSDATAAFALTGHDGRHHAAQDVHDAALASLHGEFAQIVESRELL